MEERAVLGSLRELDDGWLLNAEGHLERVYRLRNFAQAMALANKVAGIAEAEGHHPDLSIAWGERKCKVEIWTHKISRSTTEMTLLFAARRRSRFQSHGRS